jgi:hypothetical protein
MGDDSTWLDKIFSRSSTSPLANTPHYTHFPTEEDLFKEFSEGLRVYGYPPYKTIKVPPPKAPTVLILSYIEDVCHIIEEGGRLSPGNVLLALEPSWLVIPKIETDSPFHHILVKKAIYFDGKNQYYLVEYTTPRIVDYFINFYSAGGFADLPPEEQTVVAKAMELEKNFEGAMSNSAWLARDVNDKLFTRLLLSEKSVPIPCYIGFVVDIPPDKKKIFQKHIAKGTITVLTSPQLHLQCRAAIAKAVDFFVHQYPQYDEVVVKPSGIRFCGGEGVKFFSIQQRKEIEDHVLYLLEHYQMAANDAVLIDGRITPPPIYYKDRKYDWNFRVFVCRNERDEGEVTGALARIGRWGKPTNISIDATWATFDEVCRMLHLSAEETQQLWKRFVDLGPPTFQCIKEHEAKRRHASVEPYDAQTDCLGLDVMVEYRQGILTPVIIEVNDQESGGQNYLDELCPDRVGDSVRLWVKTMLRRAEEHFNGKRKFPSVAYRRITPKNLVRRSRNATICTSFFLSFVKSQKGTSFL